jgi:alkyldihydroxyacetonephosphate synthase
MASAIFRKHGGRSLGKSPARSWAKERYKMPYLRDLLLDRGVLIDTLETATTWKNLGHLYQQTKTALENAIREKGGEPLILCHLSHVYEEGASLYFSFFAKSEVEPEEQWLSIKTKASDAIAKNGGTISHHHAVGYEHRPWMKEEYGKGLEVFQALKKHFDPENIMNPGKLI